MAVWHTLSFHHPQPHELAEQLPEHFDHHPENTEIRVNSHRDNQIEICTRKEKDKLKEVMEEHLQVGDVAALAWVSNTTDTGTVYAYLRQHGQLVKMDEFVEPSRNFGRTSADMFYGEYDFRPCVEEFQIESYICITCSEMILLEEQEGPHEHKVNDGHASNTHNSDRYEIWQELQFDDEYDLDVKPDLITKVVDTENDETVKSWDDGVAPAVLTHSVGEASGFIEGIENKA